MLDTNLFVDFTQVQWLEESKKSIPKNLKNIKELRDLWLKKQFINFICPFGVWELFDCIKNKICETNLMREGYIKSELLDIIRKEGFNEKDIKSTNEIIENVINGSAYIMLGVIDEKTIDVLVKLGVDMGDTLLLYYASSNLNCEYFVTRDTTLMNTIKKIVPKIFNSLRQLPDVKVINVKEFLSILKKSSKTK